MIAGYDGTTPFRQLHRHAGANTPSPPCRSGEGTGWTFYYAYGIYNNGDIVGMRKKRGRGLSWIHPEARDAGDANTDGTVDISDLSPVLTNHDKGLSYGAS